MNKIEHFVLPEDVEEADRIVIWAKYCVAQMEICLDKFNLEGSRYWNLEYQRSINDLKALQFKKINSERIEFDAKL